MPVSFSKPQSVNGLPTIAPFTIIRRYEAMILTAGIAEMSGNISIALAVRSKCASPPRRLPWVPETNPSIVARPTEGWANRTKKLKPENPLYPHFCGAHL
jgi:hypothetical protein